MVSGLILVEIYLEMHMKRSSFITRSVPGLAGLFSLRGASPNASPVIHHGYLWRSPMEPTIPPGTRVALRQQPDRDDPFSVGVYWDGVEIGGIANQAREVVWTMLEKGFVLSGRVVNDKPAVIHKGLEKWLSIIPLQYLEIISHC